MDDQGFNARVLADSISPAGIRLTTLEVRFPRFILSEFNTHRPFQPKFGEQPGRANQ